MLTGINQIISGFSFPENFYKVGTTMKSAGVMHSTFYTNGRPGQSVANSLPISGAQLTTATGILPFISIPNGMNAYLGKSFFNSSVVGTAFICDRLWHNANISITTTTEQVVSSYSWPSRCPFPSGGNLANTSGFNVMIAIEVSNATGNLSAVTNTKMKYINSDGVADRIATIASFPLTANNGTFVPFQLASGDSGVLSVQSLTLGTSYVSGTIHLVAYRIIGIIPVITAIGGMSIDPISNCLPQMFSNSCPFIVWMPSATTACTWWGQFNYIVGN